MIIPTQLSYSTQGSSLVAEVETNFKEVHFCYLCTEPFRFIWVNNRLSELHGTDICGACLAVAMWIFGLLMSTLPEGFLQGELKLR